MLIPVILSGGSGTRLWPLSREMYPKQLLPLVGEQSMLQETLTRPRKQKRAWSCSRNRAAANTASTARFTYRPWGSYEGIDQSELVAEMLREDLKSAQRDELVTNHGYKTMAYHE